VSNEYVHQLPAIVPTPAQSLVSVDLGGYVLVFGR
jgi:hypothetical protein